MRSSIHGREWAYLLLFLFLARPLSAELVILTHGGFIEVKSYRVEDDRIHMQLPRGGELEMSLYVVESIVNEEIPSDDEPEAPAFTLRFVEGQEAPATPYGELIFAAARRYELNPRLVAAVIRAESAFDARAVSAKGAQGLMQLMPATALSHGLSGEDVFDPEKNIDAGTRYLEDLSRRFEGDLALVLAAYNAGPATVRRYGGVPPYRETHGYLRRIYAELGLDAAGLSATAAPPAAAAGTSDSKAGGR